MRRLFIWEKKLSYCCYGFTWLWPLIFMDLVKFRALMKCSYNWSKNYYLTFSKINPRILCLTNYRKTIQFTQKSLLFDENSHFLKALPSIVSSCYLFVPCWIKVNPWQWFTGCIYLPEKLKDKLTPACHSFILKSGFYS